MSHLFLDYAQSKVWMAAVLRHSLSMNVTVQQEWVPDLEDFYSLATKMDLFRFVAEHFISLVPHCNATAFCVSFVKGNWQLIIDLGNSRDCGTFSH